MCCAPQSLFSRPKAVGLTEHPDKAPPKKKLKTVDSPSEELPKKNGKVANGEDEDEEGDEEEEEFDEEEEDAPEDEGDVEEEEGGASLPAKAVKVSAAAQADEEDDEAVAAGGDEEDD